MCRGKRDAAARQMGGDEAGEHFLRSGIQRGRRLVEDPHRAPGDEELGHGHAALLAGGEIAEGQVHDAAEADRFGGLVDGRASAAVEVAEKAFQKDRFSSTVSSRFIALR